MSVDIGWAEIDVQVCGLARRHRSHTVDALGPVIAAWFCSRGPQSNPQSVIGPTAVHTGYRGPMGVRLADQSGEPAIRSRKVCTCAIVEKPSDS